MSHEDAIAERGHQRVWLVYDREGWHVLTLYAKPDDGAFDQQYPGNRVVEFAQCAELETLRINARAQYAADMRRVRAVKDERDALHWQLEKVNDDYRVASTHADRGWAFLKVAVAALYKIAQPGEGREVTGSFDEPNSAREARAALNQLPSAGAYEGTPPWPIPAERR